MAFPTASLSAPALSVAQLSFRGVAFGGLAPGAASNLQSLNGRALPTFSTGDTPRPNDQGEFIGVDSALGRDVRVVEVVRGSTGAELDAAIMARGAIMVPAGTDEEPLYMATSMGTFVCMARPRGLDFPWDVNAFVAKGIVVTSLFHATDPRWYATPIKTATVGLGAQIGGLTFNASEPFIFGGGGGGFLAVHNDGAFEMRPVLIVDGPCTNPVIANLSIPGAPQVGVGVTLNTGDRLVIDTDLRSIVYTAAGTTLGASRANALSTGTTWWNLPANQLSTLHFSSSDSGTVAGRLTVLSADAWPIV